MSYENHFRLTDDLILHLNEVVASIADPFIATRYVGFVAIAGTTVYELAIRDILVEFSEEQHEIFGRFVNKSFEKLNGRIKTSEIRGKYLPQFGDKYVKRYNRIEKWIERSVLRKRGVSVLAAYNNLIEWRNQFAHQGNIPSTPSYPEVVDTYEIGKAVIHCLARTMQG